ncbi:MAG: ATP-binding protein [Candidatus Aminicenantes bacterium]|nr:ATP-binding protein [Candidatus Aminicenantes bacterium]
MKFYDRKKELEILKALYEQSKENGRMTVLTGRRRVGKTLLALEFTKSHKYIYLFVAKKSEPLLCREYIEEIKKVYDIPVIGEIHTFKGVFSLLLEIAQKEHFTLIIDEFQEFYNINPAVYSEIQHLWDLNKNRCKLNLIFIGSIYSLVHKIFENSKEPLYQRADRVFHIRPFKIKTISHILRDYDHGDLKTLFNFYLITGGVPRYIDLLVNNSIFSFSRMLDFLLEEYSPFLNEGKNLLIEEFGKEYGTYFSILELISAGKTSRNEIESILERQVGGYLARLENDYAIISKHKPLNAKPNSRIQKYRIIDNFLNFWFRFIYRHRSAVETGNFSYIKQVINRDYNVYSGRILESFFQQLFADTLLYNRIGSYWEKGNLNEIDLVAINDMEKTIVMAEIKLNKSKIRLEVLKKKSEKLLNKYVGYRPQWLALSLEDAEEYL